MSYLWTNKYKPDNIDKITGNIDKINIIINWLNNMNNMGQSIIISGPQGIGKTLAIEIILKDMNYIVKTINANDIKEQ